MNVTANQKPWHPAQLAKDGRTVLCGKCKSGMGTMRRRVQSEYSSKRTPDVTQQRKYDPIRAYLRAVSLDGENASFQGKPCLVLNPGYIEGKDGKFILSKQGDQRSEEGSHLLAREKGMMKRAKKIFPEGKWARQEELETKERADNLRANASFLAELRKREHYLELPPFTSDSEPILAECWNCQEDVGVIVKGLIAQFEKWEAEVLATVRRL